MIIRSHPPASVTRANPMKRHCLYTLATLLLAASTHTLAQDCAVFKTPFTATYFGSFKGWRLDATQQLTQTSKKQWQFALTADNPIGSFQQTSTFGVDVHNSIISDHYQSKQKVLVKSEVLNTVFDWQKKQATSTHKGKTHTVKLQGDELDELNYQLALRCDLQAGKTEFSYPVVDRKELDLLDFKVVGEEKLATELGTLDTVVVKRIRNNNNRITTLWFAKDLDYQMVKLLQEERKDTEAYLLYIKSVSKP